MRFSFKVFLITIIFLAISFSIGCYVLIHSVFKDTLNQEIKQSFNENQILGFAFETAFINLPSNYENIKDTTVADISKSLETSDLFFGSYIRVSAESYNSIYENVEMDLDNSILEEALDNKLVYKITQFQNDYYIQTVFKLAVRDRTLYLETMRNVSHIFRQRQNHFERFQTLTMVMITISSIVMIFISNWLTRPIKRLSKAARIIANGDLSKRVKCSGDDEIGQLTKDFNYMSASLEEKVIKLQENARQQEEFVGSFSHELKTPLTAIIGYADMLRSRKMEEEKQFIAANYIFNEGKRLETLSLTLLDMIILRKENFVMKSLNSSAIFSDIEFSLIPILNMDEIVLKMEFDEAMITVEPTLIKSLLINLLDNARKASKKGSIIEFLGKVTKEGYRFLIKDHGCGIEEEHLNKITEAFYVVDKSRAKSQNGTGLGLALCVEIANLHKGILEFESDFGKGTTVSFLLKSDMIP